MIICCRPAFIALVKGILLDRQGQKIVALGDGAQAALAAHDRGEPIYLAEDGIIISKMQNHVETLLYGDE